MSNRATIVPLGFGLLALLCASAGRPAEDARAARPPVRVYTNDDLERVRPFRAETGVLSVPAAPADPPGREGPARETRKGRGEDYWRREAARVRERLRAMEERAAGLRSQIAERGREPGPTLRPRGRSAAGRESAASLRARLDALERRMRETEDDLADRARREGALPGWLRE